MVYYLHDPAFDLMCEPWCWEPAVIARLTDRDIEDIRAAQYARNELAKKQAKKDEPPPDLPSDPSRKGALWEYLVSTGMSHAEADEVTKSQR